MVPLYPPGLDENGAVVKLYPASWICSKSMAPQGTIGVTAWYNFSPDSLVTGTVFFPGSEVSGTIFFPDSNSF